MQAGGFCRAFAYGMYLGSFALAFASHPHAVRAPVRVLVGGTDVESACALTSRSGVHQLCGSHSNEFAGPGLDLSLIHI